MCGIYMAWKYFSCDSFMEQISYKELLMEQGCKGRHAQDGGGNWRSDRDSFNCDVSTGTLSCLTFFIINVYSLF